MESPWSTPTQRLKSSQFCGSFLKNNCFKTAQDCQVCHFEQKTGDMENKYMARVDSKYCIPIYWDLGPNHLQLFWRQTDYCRDINRASAFIKCLSFKQCNANYKKYKYFLQSWYTKALSDHFLNAKPLYICLDGDMPSMK